MQPRSTLPRLILVLALFATLASACSDSSTAPREQWSKVSVGTTSNLTAVDILASGSGTIVGDTGTVYATSDHGRTWTKQSSPVRSDFTAVHQLANGDAIAATAQGEVLWRKSGKWTVVAYSPNALALEAIAVSGDTVYVTGGGIRLNSASSAFVRSFNAGKNWEAVPAIEQKLFMWIRSLAITAGSRIILVGKCYPAGLCSSNIEVVKVASGAVQHLGLSSYGTPEDIAMIESGAGLIAGTCIARTSDAGLTWAIQRQLRETPATGVDLHETGFGLLIGGSGSVEATFDTARTWHRHSTGSSRDLNDVSIADATLAIVVGDEGTVLRFGK